VRAKVWLGEALRWYLASARHPFKAYVVGHYWPWFSKLRPWIRYDTRSVIHLHLSDYLQQRIFFSGYYEAELIAWMKRTLRPTDIFWDVGANVGAITLVAAPLCHRVVAFEPNPLALVSLRENIMANRLCNVEVIAAALGDRTGSARLYQSPENNAGMSSLLSERSMVAGVAEVSVLRTDDILRERPEIAPNVVKIDVEGAEHLVLQGAAGLLQSRQVRAIVFEDRRNAHRGPERSLAVDHLRNAHYQVESFGSSDPDLVDEAENFLATLNIP
jgi:FkbM family methyltransferase